MDEKKLFDKLDKMTKLLAIMAISGKSFKEQVKLLSEQGLQPAEIAEITGKTANFVRVTKSGLKQKKSSADESE
jgi:hypothetical protein